jgi:hypothetical protein
MEGDSPRPDASIRQNLKRILKGFFDNSTASNLCHIEKPK